MTLGQFCTAEVNGKQVNLSNSIYQSYKVNPQPFTVDGIQYTSIKKHSTQVLSKAVKTKWYTFTDGSMMEVVSGEDYTPQREVESVCWRSIKTWFVCE